MCQPSSEANLASVAAAIAEPSRAKILCVLMDGRAHTATELAVCADIAPSTASGHLQRLFDNGLVRRLSQGRHRYYALNGRDVAAMLETLLNMPMPRTPPVRTPPALRLARSCYDHIAGTVAVVLHDRLMEERWLQAEDNGYRLSTEGTAGLEALGVGTGGYRKGGRRFAYPCLDWSERRPHLGGWLGAQLMDHLIGRGWLRRQVDGRALTVTPAGRQGLRRTLGIILPEGPATVSGSVTAGLRQPST